MLFALSQRNRKSESVKIPIPTVNNPDFKEILEANIEMLIARSVKSAIAKNMAKKVLLIFASKRGNTGSSRKAAPTELNPKQRIAESRISTRPNLIFCKSKRGIAIKRHG